MTKHSNPFYTLAETTAVLKSLGVDPLRNLPEGLIDWRKHVTNITCDANYDLDHSKYFIVNIHMSNEGFDELLLTLNGDTCDGYDAASGRFKVTKKLISSDYEMYSIQPSELLRIFKLVYIPEDSQQ